MKLNDETGLPGLREYLAMLANGIRDEGVRVNVRYYSDRRSWKFHGFAQGNHIDIEIGRGITYPSKIVDRYMSKYVRLADLYNNPHVAANAQEMIGFIFIHELHHVRQFRKNRKAANDSMMHGTPVRRKAKFVSESECTRWAYDHWKPMPEEMLKAGMQRALDNYAEAIKIAQAREFREAQRETPAAKLEVLQQRLKRVDTRMKRLATSRKKLERKIGYYQRQVQ